MLEQVTYKDTTLCVGTGYLQRYYVICWNRVLTKIIHYVLEQVTYKDTT